jgi:hypothetical protein
VATLLERKELLQLFPTRFHLVDAELTAKISIEHRVADAGERQIAKAFFSKGV